MLLRLLGFKAAVFLCSSPFGLAVLLLAAFPSVVLAQTANQNATLDQFSLNAKDPIVFLGGEGHPPYSSVENGSPVGANVDLVRKLGKVLGRPVDYRVYNWVEAQARFANGKGNPTFLGELNQGISKLKSTGKIKEISQKWLGERVLFFTQDEKNAALIGAVTAVIVFTVLITLLALSMNMRTKERDKATKQLAERTGQRDLAEAQLLQSQRMETVGQLTGGIAHDFNNLMAIMMGNLEAAMDKATTDIPLRNNIKVALKAVDRGTALTQQLLSFSRQQTLSPRVEDLNEVIEGTLKFLGRTLGENIQIVTDLGKDDLLISIDAAIFGNALVNIALNARDAMPDGGTLTVRAIAVELSNEMIRPSTEPATGPFALITIADTGGGIDPRDLDQVMEPFFTTKEVGKGSGLGLSMVYGFVTQSNGRMEIASKLGEGTTISLYFPIVDAKPAKQDNGYVPFPNAHIDRTILLVEDEELVREAASVTLEDLGYTVIEAEDGPSALEILNQRSGDIDLILSDIIMPNNMSGIELAKKIATDYKHVNVLLTSGYPDKIAGVKDVKALGIELLAKPYKRAQLAEAIENAVSGQK